MRVMITGGAGYIGSILTDKLLKENYKVKVFDSLVFGANHLVSYFNNPNFELIKEDLCNIKAIQKAVEECDIVINLAALVFTGGEKLSKYVMDVNYGGFVNVYNACKQHKVSRLIQISTCSNYGISDDIVTEESPLSSTNVYAKSKIKCEEHLNGYSSPNTTVLRMSTVFGLSPRMRFDLTVNDFVMQSFMNKKIEVFNPYAWRPGIHIDDATNVIVQCCKKFYHENLNGVFNIGDDSLNFQKTTITDIIKKKMPELKVILKKIESSDTRNYKVSFKKMKMIGYQPKKTLEEGINEILDALQKRVYLHPHDTYHNNLKTYHLYYHDQYRKDKSGGI